MATAVIISGQARTFDKCYPTQRWHVYRHYQRDAGPNSKAEEPHFFVSIANDADAFKMEVLREHYKNVHIEKVDDPTDLPEIPDALGEWAPYKNAASHRALMLQHWGNKLAWDFFLKKQGDTNFDTFIRIRADQFFHRFIKPRDPIPKEAHTPWWGKFGGVNDRFAILGSDAAFPYFYTYGRIHTLLKEGCPFHPETLVYESMRFSGVRVHRDLLASFSTLRLNGHQRWPEVTNEDIAELIAYRSHL